MPDLIGLLRNLEGLPPREAFLCLADPLAGSAAGKPVAARGLVNGRGPRRKAWEG